MDPLDFIRPTRPKMFGTVAVYLALYMYGALQGILLDLFMPGLGAALNVKAEESAKALFETVDPVAGAIAFPLLFLLQALLIYFAVSSAIYFYRRQHEEKQ